MAQVTGLVLLVFLGLGLWGHSGAKCGSAPASGGNATVRVDFYGEVRLAAAAAAAAAGGTLRPPSLAQEGGAGGERG